MAIENCLQWIVCVTLVLFARGGGYRREYETHPYVHPQEPEAGDAEGYTPYRSEAFYREWGTRGEDSGRSYVAERRDGSRGHREHGRGRRPQHSTRAENGTYKIVNVPPATSHSNLRGIQVQGAHSDSKDEIATSLRDSIVFPEAPARLTKGAGAEGARGDAAQKFQPHVTEACKEGPTLCVNVANYPDNYIAGILSNSADDLQHQLTVDEIESVIAQRFGEDPNEFELCSFQERVVFPQAAQNKDSKWLMVINQQNYKQGFRVEVCQKENSSCDPAVSFRLGMEAYCKQKFVLRKMAAVDEFGQVVMDHFRLPSCCSCTVRYIDPYGVGRKRRRTRQEP